MSVVMCMHASHKSTYMCALHKKYIHHHKAIVHIVKSMRMQIKPDVYNWEARLIWNVESFICCFCSSPEL